MEMKNVYHGHLVTSRFDDTGWTHEVRTVQEARRSGSGWAWKAGSEGPVLGVYLSLSEAIAEAKRRNPPEPLPRVENVTIIEETEQ